MLPKDIPECVEMVAEHPVIGPRYGEVIGQLGDAWRKLLGQEAFVADVFETREGSGYKKVGLGVRVFVDDSFVSDIKTPPHFWAGPELVRRVLEGRSPVLSDKGVSQANARSGLNLLIWESPVRGTIFERQEILHAVLNVFIDHHKGFYLKELISHGVDPDVVGLQLRSGGFFLEENGSYTNTPRAPLGEILKAPHCIGVTRDLALREYGTWISSLFIHRPPRFGFRPSEQRLLLAALRGGTDEEVSDELGVSRSAVKKTWRLIYDRVAQIEPGLVPMCPQDGNLERGKTKKQRLLSHLREHMEELRPTAR